MTRIALLVAAAVALAVVGTWPLAARLSTHVYDPSGDCHCVSSRDADIFHPAHDTLALSEHMLGAMPVYLPLAAMTRPRFAPRSLRRGNLSAGPVPDGGAAARRQSASPSRS